MKVAIIDNHCLVRQGLKSILSMDNNIEIAGESSNVKDGLKLILESEPDIAIIDLKLGNENGLDIVKGIKGNMRRCKFIILTTSSDYRDFRKAEEIGIEGYILKDALPEEIIYGVKIVKAGRKFYDANLMTSAMRLEKSNSINDPAVNSLTQREKEVLAAVGKGLCNNEIASSLYITEYTVKKHVSQILNKLGFSDRTQAAIYANTHGLVG